MEGKCKDTLALWFWGAGPEFSVSLLQYSLVWPSWVWVPRDFAFPLQEDQPYTPCTPVSLTIKHLPMGLRKVLNLAV